VLSGRRGLAIALAFVVLVCGAVGTLGVMAMRQVASNAAADPRASVPTDASPAVAGGAPSDTAEPSPAPSPSPSPSRKPRPKPSRKPVKVAKPPAPPKKPASCPVKRSGTAAPRATVKTALTNAAALRPWGSGSPVSVPLNLVEAVGWQETSWQSNLTSCVGAIGVMQLTPATATWMNQRFGLSYNLHDVAGNAALGSVHLQWLVKYFGDVYFQGNYDLTVVDPNNPTLLDAVIAAYNVGFGAVDTSTGLKIPNRPYVNAVERWMKDAPWNG
jgi:soluble lytic murein transglycosylase-like protein